MIARLRKFINALKQTFWVVPALIVLGGALLAVALVDLDRSGPCPNRCWTSAWLYNSGGTGARTLLGAAASSTVEVAGTVFSIVESPIAAPPTPRTTAPGPQTTSTPIPPMIAHLSSEKANGIGA